VWIPWRCCIWSTWIGRAARASQEGREQLHCLLPSTRSSTSRRFRCICASSANLVISDSGSSCFTGKILFCASVATPYRFKTLSSGRVEADNQSCAYQPTYLPGRVAGSGSPCARQVHCTNEPITPVGIKTEPKSSSSSGEWRVDKKNIGSHSPILRTAPR
jgi:hypothetical protein